MVQPDKVKSNQSSHEIIEGAGPSALSFSSLGHDSSQVLRKTTLNSDSTSPLISVLPINSKSHSQSTTNSKSCFNSAFNPNSNSNSNPTNSTTTTASPNLKNSSPSECPKSTPASPPSFTNPSPFTLHPTTRSTLEEFLSMEKTLTKFLNGSLDNLGLNFQAWDWSFHELYAITLGMFIRLNLIDPHSPRLNHLLDLIMDISKSYFPNPYHGFPHAVDVTFLCYFFLYELDTATWFGFTQLEMSSLLIAALAHDMCHPGTNNLYQVNAQTQVWKRFGEKSNLEKQSCWEICRLLDSSKWVKDLDLNHCWEESDFEMLKLLLDENGILTCDDFVSSFDIPSNEENIPPISLPSSTGINETSANSNSIPPPILYPIPTTSNSLSNPVKLESQLSPGNMELESSNSSPSKRLSSLSSPIPISASKRHSSPYPNPASTSPRNSPPIMDSGNRHGIHTTTSASGKRTSSQFVDSFAYKNSVPSPFSSSSSSNSSTSLVENTSRTQLEDGGLPLSPALNSEKSSMDGIIFPKLSFLTSPSPSIGSIPPLSKDSSQVKLTSGDISMDSPRTSSPRPQSVPTSFIYQSFIEGLKDPNPDTYFKKTTPPQSFVLPPPAILNPLPTSHSPSLGSERYQDTCSSSSLSTTSSTLATASSTPPPYSTTPLSSLIAVAVAPLVSSPQLKLVYFKELILETILNTDMSVHFQMLEDLAKLIDSVGMEEDILMENSELEREGDGDTERDDKDKGMECLDESKENEVGKNQNSSQVVSVNNSSTTSGSREISTGSTFPDSASPDSNPSEIPSSDHRNSPVKLSSSMSHPISLSSEASSSLYTSIKSTPSSSVSNVSPLDYEESNHPSQVHKRRGSKRDSETFNSPPLATPMESDCTSNSEIPRSSTTTSLSSTSSNTSSNHLDSTPCDLTSNSPSRRSHNRGRSLSSPLPKPVHFPTLLTSIPVTEEPNTTNTSISTTTTTTTSSSKSTNNLTMPTLPEIDTKPNGQSGKFSPTSPLPTTPLPPIPTHYRRFLLSVILHSCDISNGARPTSIMRKWSDLVLQEFFHQGDLEKSGSLPISPNMDRSSTNQARCSLDFNQFLVRPLFGLLAEVVPMADIFVKWCDVNRAWWEREALEDEAKQREQEQLHVEGGNGKVSSERKTMNSESLTPAGIPIAVLDSSFKPFSNPKSNSLPNSNSTSTFQDSVMDSSPSASSLPFPSHDLQFDSSVSASSFSSSSPSFSSGLTSSQNLESPVSSYEIERVPSKEGALELSQFPPSSVLLQTTMKSSPPTHDFSPTLSLSSPGLNLNKKPLPSMKSIQTESDFSPLASTSSSNFVRPSTPPRSQTFPSFAIGQIKSNTQGGSPTSSINSTTCTVEPLLSPLHPHPSTSGGAVVVGGGLTENFKLKLLPTSLPFSAFNPPPTNFNSNSNSNPLSHSSPHRDSSSTSSPKPKHQAITDLLYDQDTVSSMSVSGPSPSSSKSHPPQFMTRRLSVAAGTVEIPRSGILERVGGGGPSLTSHSLFFLEGLGGLSLSDRETLGHGIGGASNGILPGFDYSLRRGERDRSVSWNQSFSFAKTRKSGSLSTSTSTSSSNSSSSSGTGGSIPLFNTKDSRYRQGTLLSHRRGSEDESLLFRKKLALLHGSLYSDKDSLDLSLFDKGNLYGEIRDMTRGPSSLGVHPSRNDSSPTTSSISTTNDGLITSSSRVDGFSSPKNETFESRLEDPSNLISQGRRLILRRASSLDNRHVRRGSREGGVGGGGSGGGISGEETLDLNPLMVGRSPLIQNLVNSIPSLPETPPKSPN